MSSSKSFVAKDVAYHKVPRGEDQVNVALDDKIMFDEEGMNLLQAMRTVYFWLLFIAMVCGMGSTQAVLNNLSQIGQSLNYTTVEVNNFFSLWSIWNCISRVGVGYLSDYLLHTRLGKTIVDDCYSSNDSCWPHCYCFWISWSIICGFDHNGHL